MYEELVKRLREAATMSDALSLLLPNAGGNAIAKLHRDAANAIEELLAKDTNVPSKWISVDDRMPKANEYDSRGYAVPYLVMNGWMRVTARRKDDCWVLFGNGTVLEYVTHWMPLPEAPEEDT